MDTLTLQGSTRFWQNLTTAELRALLHHFELVKQAQREARLNAIQRQRQAVKDTFRGMEG